MSTDSIYLYLEVHYGAQDQKSSIAYHVDRGYYLLLQCISLFRYSILYTHAIYTEATAMLYGGNDFCVYADDPGLT